MSKKFTIETLEAVPPATRGISRSENREDVLESIKSLVDFKILQKLTPWARAGWQFIPREREIGNNPYDGGGFRILIDEDGEVKIEGRSMVVKFDPTLSEDDINALLKSYGASIKRWIRPAPNLVQAIVDPLQTRLSPLIDLAERIEGDDGVEYARPELIENIPNR